MFDVRTYYDKKEPDLLSLSNQIISKCCRNIYESLNFLIAVITTYFEDITKLIEVLRGQPIKVNLEFPKLHFTQN